MSADRGRRYSWQNDQAGQESIPLHDLSPNDRTSQTQSSSVSAGSKDLDVGFRKTAGQLGRRRAILNANLGEYKQHTLAIWLILIYACIAILSWTITCVLTYQPIGVPTYFDQTGNYSRSHYETTDNWRKVASVGRSIVGVTSIPVTSAICAKVAAVYCQRISNAKAPPLTLRRMLALADKGWSDSATLLDVVRPSTSRRTRSPLLILSVGLVAIAFMIPVIQTSIVGNKHISVLSSQDVTSATILGFQVTPQTLNSLTDTSVMDNIISSTITGKLSDKQPFLWSTNSLGIRSVDANIANSSSFNDIPKTQFIATFPVGTDTGVLRDLVLRLNMSVSCSLVPQSDFPSTCPGDIPLSQTFSNINSSTSAPFGDLLSPRYHARICAPGNTMLSPWRDTPDRQDITEEFWLDYQRTIQPADGSLWGITDGRSNYTQHCYGNSTLGYFELPNYWNGQVAGPLLDKVPPNGPNLTYQNGYPQELTSGLPSPALSGRGVSGPFLTAIMAIFGPKTFFTAAAANSNATSSPTNHPLCAQLRYPFTNFAYYSSFTAYGDFRTNWVPASAPLACQTSVNKEDPAPTLLRALMSWLPNFGDHDKATAALTLTTYAAANSILNVGPGLQNDLYYISTSPGTSIQKPDISLTGVIVVSILLAIQIIGLTLMAVDASRKVTWTGALDSWAMLRLGAEIGRENLPAVSAFKAKRAGVLDAQKGWVGDLGVEGREGEVELRELGLGGEERVRGGALYRIVKGKGGDG